ncbi:NUDIX domain-containing protein [Streptomyces globisporus]|uniref:NUDIX domain-containing protein n=1 Tax=Streptomyces globisporus TaxID=1908 RepID=UPI00378C3274
MSSSLPPSARVASQSVLSAAQYAATRHAVWLGAAAIITDQVGRVLLVHPTYHEDDRWLLPGGVVEPGEHPYDTCRREITEELGLSNLPLTGVLAVHSLSSHQADLRSGMSCPGEIRYVFDGGTLPADQAEAICLPREELSEFAFFETRDAVQRLRSVDGQIMLAAYRARLGNTATAHLADGQHILDVPALDHHDVHVRYRPMWDSPLNHGPVPERLPVQQAWAWCFVPDVMQADSVSRRLVSQAQVVGQPPGSLPQTVAGCHGSRSPFPKGSTAPPAIPRPRARVPAV